MAGLVRPSTPRLLNGCKKDVDARDKRRQARAWRWKDDSMTSEPTLAQRGQAKRTACRRPD